MNLNHEIAFTLAKARQADLIREADEFRRAQQALRDIDQTGGRSVGARLVRAGRRAPRREPAYR